MLIDFCFLYYKFHCEFDVLEERKRRKMKCELDIQKNIE